MTTSNSPSEPTDNKSYSRLLGLATRLESLALSMLGKLGGLSIGAFLVALWLAYSAMQSFTLTWTWTGVLFGVFSLPSLLLGLAYWWLQDAVGLPERTRAVVARLRPAKATEEAEPSETETPPAPPPQPAGGVMRLGRTLWEIYSLGDDIREITFGAGGLIWLANPIVLATMAVAAAGAIALVFAGAVSVLFAVF